MPAPKRKPSEAVAPSLASTAAAGAAAGGGGGGVSEARRGRGYTQQIEAKFAETGVGKTLRIAEKKKPASRMTLTKSAAKAAAVARAEEEEQEEEGGSEEGEAAGALSPEAVAEVERELENGGQAVDESLLGERDRAQIERLVETKADPRVLALFKASSLCCAGMCFVCFQPCLFFWQMGTALESQMAASMEVDDVGSAEELVDAAVAKYSALLLLDGTNHCALRRLAAALVRKAEFREGEAADFAYERAIAAFDKDAAAWPEWAGEIHELKVRVSALLFHASQTLLRNRRWC